MAAFAKYRVACPKKDNLGNPLKNVAAAAHTHLVYGLKRPVTKGSWVENGIQGHWDHDEPEQFDHLVFIAPDEPETDAHVKALGAQIAEACNQWGVFIVKEGQKGVVPWEIANPVYRHGEPADPAALVDPQVQPAGPSGTQGAPGSFGNLDDDGVPRQSKVAAWNSLARYLP